MIYVLYEIETGRAVSIGSTPIEYAREGYAVYESGAPYSDLSQYEWSTDTCTLETRVTVAPAAQRTMSASNFMRRLGFEREVALRSLLFVEAVDAQTKGAIATLSAWLDRVIGTEVNLDDPITVRGAGVIADAEAFVAEMRADVGAGGV